jgi:hypothetical protein
MHCVEGVLMLKMVIRAVTTKSEKGKHLIRVNT